MRSCLYVQLQISLASSHQLHNSFALSTTLFSRFLPSLIVAIHVGFIAHLVEYYSVQCIAPAYRYLRTRFLQWCGFSLAINRKKKNYNLFVHSLLIDKALRSKNIDIVPKRIFIASSKVIRIPFAKRLKANDPIITTLFLPGIATRNVHKGKNDRTRISLLCLKQ